MHGSNQGRGFAEVQFGQRAFHDDAVTVSQADAKDYDELKNDVSLPNRIHALLGRGAKTSQEIANEMDGDNSKTVYNRLSEGVKSGRFAHANGKYFLPAHESR